MTVGDKIAQWAAGAAVVQAVTLIGSQVRSMDDVVWRADAKSDWDFQIITSKPEQLLRPEWLRSAGLLPRVYSVRRAAIGGVPKIAALFSEGEADFVVLPSRPLRVMRCMVKVGIHRHSARLRRVLQDLALIIRPGWKFLKGGAQWEPFYRRVVTDISDARLHDSEAIILADSFVCDYVWTHRKLERGELAAAQRMLHRSLAETNLKLLHELRLRRGERSFPEARRIERLLSQDELNAVVVNAALSEEMLRAATERAATTLRQLMRDLAGGRWRWPLADPTRQGR